MKLPQVIFSIDDGQELRSRKQFLKYIDNLIATGAVTYCAQCVGLWEGVLEASYMVRLSDWEEHIKGSFFVENQVCVLVIPGDIRQPCTFLRRDGTSYSGGVMKEVSFEEAMACTGWTYVEETQKFYILEG